LTILIFKNDGILKMDLTNVLITDEHIINLLNSDLLDLNSYDDLEEVSSEVIDDVFYDYKNYTEDDIEEWLNKKIKV